MTATKHTPVAVGAFLTAWEALCAWTGRKSLTAGRVAQLRGCYRCGALEWALTQLGYPEALTSGARLGAALRRLWGLRDEQGRYLERSRGAKGSIWYVVGPTAAALAGGHGGDFAAGIAEIDALVRGRCEELVAGLEAPGPVVTGRRDRLLAAWTAMVAHWEDGA